MLATGDTSVNANGFLRPNMSTAAVTFSQRTLSLQPGQSVQVMSRKVSAVHGHAATPLIGARSMRILSRKGTSPSCVRCCQVTVTINPRTLGTSEPYLYGGYVHLITPNAHPLTITYQGATRPPGDPSRVPLVVPAASLPGSMAGMNGLICKLDVPYFGSATTAPIYDRVLHRLNRATCPATEATTVAVTRAQATDGEGLCLALANVRHVAERTITFEARQQDGSFAVVGKSVQLGPIYGITRGPGVPCHLMPVDLPPGTYRVTLTLTPYVAEADRRARNGRNTVATTERHTFRQLLQITA